MAETSRAEKQRDISPLDFASPSRKPTLPSQRRWEQQGDEEGSSVAVLRVSHHRLELTQAAVGWFVSVVVWKVTDKSKHSASHGIVPGREISWELSAGFPPHLQPFSYTDTIVYHSLVFISSTAWLSAIVQVV